MEREQILELAIEVTNDVIADNEDAPPGAVDSWSRVIACSTENLALLDGHVCPGSRRRMSALNLTAGR